jgi:hypothetical protein
MKIFPMILYRKGGSREKQGVVYIEKQRWKVERAIAWLQRKFRRIVVRWERKRKYWEGFLTMALVVFWAFKILKFLKD